MVRWLKQYYAISKKSFILSLGDPFFLSLILLLLIAMALFACAPSFTFGEHLRLIRDQSLALSFVGGCAAAILGAIRLLVEDIRRGATPILMSRPVSPICYISGKWTGLTAAVLVVHSTASVAGLWVTRFSIHSTDHLDITTISIYFSSILFALTIMAIKHYLFRKCYVWQANVAILLSFFSAFLVANFIDDHGSLQSFGAGIDWPTMKGYVLLAFALILYQSAVIPVAVIFDIALVLLFGISLFFFGLISEYLINTSLSSETLTLIAKAILPNWQMFWVSDKLAENAYISPIYIGHCFIHSLLWSIIAISIATMLFSKQEIQN